MSVFRDSEKMLDDMFAVAAVYIAYRRNGKYLAQNIPAKLGRNLAKTDCNSNITVRIAEHDFIVRTKDLCTLDSPKKGDEIIWDGCVYMVAAPESEPCWKWHTRHCHTQMRIHTRYIRRENE